MSQATSYPLPTSRAATAAMRANPSRDTGPEVRVRSLLHAMGYRYRKDLRIDLPDCRVRTDIAFTRMKVAVFIDGCFWHSCPEHRSSPKANSGYWGPKLARNVERDRHVTRHLEDAGWTVIRIWEHVPAEQAAAHIISKVKTVQRHQGSRGPADRRPARTL
jgi:DNA mismatch endonuclease (patch repair protein)